MNAQYKAHVDRVLAQLQPQRLLCLGGPCRSLLDDYLRNQPGCQLELLAGDVSRGEWERLGRFDLIVVIDTLEQLDKAAAEQLLARLRDLHGGRMLTVVALGAHPQHASHWEANELLAFGMKSLGTVRETTGEYQIYLFDLFDYKTVPDWFNPRFWAHPERWDKDAW